VKFKKFTVKTCIICGKRMTYALNLSNHYIVIHKLCWKLVENKWRTENEKIDI